MRSAKRKPWSSETPGITFDSVRATWSNVLGSSFRTITSQFPPSPEPGPPVRGRSSVSVAIALRARDLDGEVVEARGRRLRLLLLVPEDDLELAPVDLIRAGIGQ